MKTFSLSQDRTAIYGTRHNFSLYIDNSLDFTLRIFAS